MGGWDVVAILSIAETVECMSSIGSVWYVGVLSYAVNEILLNMADMDQLKAVE